MRLVAGARLHARLAAVLLHVSQPSLANASDVICTLFAWPLSLRQPTGAAGWHTCRVAGGGSCCRSPSTMDVPLRRWFMKRTSASRRKSCRGSHSHASCCSASQISMRMACSHMLWHFQQAAAEQLSALPAGMQGPACQDAGQAVRQAGSKRPGLHLCCCPTWNVMGKGPGAGLGACAAASSSRRTPIGVCDSFSPPAPWPAGCGTPLKPHRTISWMGVTQAEQQLITR